MYFLTYTTTYVSIKIIVDKENVYLGNFLFYHFGIFTNMFSGICSLWTSILLTFKH